MRRMYSCVFVIVLGVLCASVLAHPGSGIVVTENGTIYFADVAQRTIWKVSPDGMRTALLRNHWTHDLKLTGDGTLYYEAEGDGNGGPAPRSLWRIEPDSKPERLIAYTNDFASFAGEPFTIDAEGNVYFAHSERDHSNNWRAILRKRTPNGDVSTLAGGHDNPLYADGTGTDATFRIVTAMTTGPDGAIYLCDRDHVRRVSLEGEVTTLVTALIDAKPSDPPEKRGPPTTINRLYGMCVADDGTVYIAYHAGRRVIAVSSDGIKSVAYRCPADWAPIGVAHCDGRLYILENPDSDSDNSGLRVQRVDADGTVEAIVKTNE